MAQSKPNFARRAEIAEKMVPGASMLQRPGYAITKAATRSLNEIGTSGLRQYGGYVLEEWLTQIQGRRAAWVWREMLDNSPVIGAILYAIEWLARGVEYRVDDRGNAKAGEFVEECMHDMSHSWEDVISEALSCLPYGWAYHEIVYKQRKGQRPNSPSYSMPSSPGSSVGLPTDTQESTSPAASSKFDDGKIGWRRLPIRAQETLHHWWFDGYSGIAAMEQIDYHGGHHIIPIEKALLFRSRPRRNNPEGYSILRTAYTSYFMLKNIQQIEAIGIERDLAGLPVLTPPEGVDIFAPGNSDLLNLAKELVTGIKRDEDSGVILPTAGWELELMSSGGSRQIDTDEVIRRYEQRIATSVLADFVLVGQDAVGSYAMVDIKSDLFGVALDGILDLICGIFNRYAIPRLLKINGMSVDDPPQITHASAGRIALDKVGTFLQSLALAGAPIPWSVEMIRHLFQQAGLPANLEDHEKPETLPTLPRPLPETEPVGRGTSAQGSKTKVNQPGGVQGSGTTAQAATRQVKKSMVPPNLRDTDSDTVNCHTCIFMGDDGICNRYDYPVEPDDVCDSWATNAIQKAQRSRTNSGTAVRVGPHLRHRAQALSAQLEREMQAALAELGTHAGHAYEQLAHKAGKPNIRRIVTIVMTALDIKGWVQRIILPLLHNHAARVMSDTQRTLNTEVQLEMAIADDRTQQIAARAGQYFMPADIEAQVCDSITQAIEDGYAAGEAPMTTARKIRENVPAGRFTRAGSRYRSQLIARNETANLQREATLALYQSNPNITAIRLQDGIYGPPRSDSACIARDGDIVSKEGAELVHPFHIQCTLGFEPVVSGTLPPQTTEPSLI